MNDNSREPLTVNRKTMKEVKDFIYLGSKMQADGDSEPDVKLRVFIANQTFSMLKNLLTSKKVQSQNQDSYFEIKCSLCACRTSQMLEIFQKRYFS